MSNQEVIVSGIHFDLTEPLQSMANDEVRKLFNHDQKMIHVRVTLEMSKNKAHRDQL
jgi:ribosome-associated translation inhibitor RaiA